jgi:hypothetical protein
MEKPGGALELQRGLLVLDLLFLAKQLAQQKSRCFGEANL